MEEVNGHPVNQDFDDVKDIISAFESILPTFNKEREILALARYQEMPKFKKPAGILEKINILRGYHKKDPLFGQLIDSLCNYAVLGPDWEHVDEEAEMEIIKGKEKEEKVDYIEKIWRAWDERLNLKVGGLFPGTEEIDKWIMRDLALTGMSVLEWKWSTVKLFSDSRYKPYQLPVVMVNYPVESVRLERRGNSWLDYEERIYIKKREQKKGTQAVPEADKDSAEVSKNEYRRLERMWAGGTTGSFCLKFGWSPGAVKVTDESQSVDTGLSLYASPPFENCIPWLMQREALCSSDVRLLDGVINYILGWKIGDKDLPMKPQQKNKDGTIKRKGDFQKMKELIEQYGAQKVLEIFLPWFIEPKFYTPPTDTLLSRDKYIEATAEILYRFGILSPANPEKQMETFDSVGFEGIIEDFRRYNAQFWNLLSKEIAERNNLESSPRRKYSPLPFTRKELLSSIQKSHQSGEISTETMNRLLGVDPRVERSRIFKEVLRGDRKVYEKAVPVQFSQTVAKDGEKKTENTSKTPHRPEGVEEEEERKLAE